MECGIVPQYTMPGLEPKWCSREAKPVPSKAVAKTPYELWTSKKPSIRHLHVWGCPTEARPYKPNEKLDSKKQCCYFVGYFERSRGFKFYDPQLGPSLKRAMLSSLRMLNSSCSSYGTDSSSSKVTQQPQEPQVQVPLRRSTRERISTISDDYVVYLQEHEFDMGAEGDPISMKSSQTKFDSKSG
ncbi:hypothetical protein AAG906_040141 [Vitis piasezkii]